MLRQVLIQNQIISLKINSDMLKDLQTLTKTKNRTQSDILREALGEYIMKNKLNNKNSFAKKTSKYKGFVSLAEDLSTNKIHLEGFGK